MAKFQQDQQPTFYVHVGFGRSWPNLAWAMRRLSLDARQNARHNNVAQYIIARQIQRKICHRKMPRQTPSEALHHIESIVANSADGISIAAIAAELAVRSGPTPNRRTLQRRLQKLIEAKRVITEGESVALIYKLPHSGSRASVPLPPRLTTQEPSATEQYVPIGPESETLRTYVRKPLMHRQPVAYQRAFLERYEPGHTFYLPSALRRQLHEMGRTAADERPAGTYARDILGRLLVDMSWASSKLEGNTYSRLDTQNLIEFGQVAKGKDAIETQMILNHKTAIEMLIDGVDEIGFDAFTFKNLHAALSQDLMRDPQAVGRLRRRPVDISGTVFMPVGLPQVIEDCFLLMLGKAAAIPDPFEQAFFLMVQLPYLQPFEDVNKRVSRIGANIPLFKHNLCPLSFVDVPEQAYIEGTLSVYELNKVALLRDVFVWAYERSCQRYLAITQAMVEPDPLKIKYREAIAGAVQTMVKELQKPNKITIKKMARQLAERTDEAAFGQMLTHALQQLHEGSISRFRIRKSEFVAWQQAFSRGCKSSRNDQ